MKHRPARSAVPLAAVAAGAWLLAWGAGTVLPAQSPVKSSGFINAGAPYPQCHASTVVETSTRELVAAWFGGTREGAQDVGIWVARREDGRWLEAVEVANGRQPDGTRQPTWNPVLFQAPKGPLLLFFKAGPSPRQWWGMVTASSDGGRTWGLPERLPGDVLRADQEQAGRSRRRHVGVPVEHRARALGMARQVRTDPRREAGVAESSAQSTVARRSKQSSRRSSCTPPAGSRRCAGRATAYWR